MLMGSRPEQMKPTAAVIMMSHSTWPQKDGDVVPRVLYLAV